MGQATPDSAGFRRIRRMAVPDLHCHRTPSRQIQRTVDTDILDELRQGLLHPKRIVRLNTIRISSARRESRSHPPRSLRKRRWWGTLVGSLTVVTSAFMGVKRAVATEVYVPLPLSLSLHHT